MIQVRKLTPEGEAQFAAWLATAEAPAAPPLQLMAEPMAVPYGDFMVDECRKFNTRLEFGIYLTQQLASAEFSKLMEPESDGLWAWLAVVYFGQLTEKGVRRSEHYVVTRKGAAGSLAYRHSVRTSYELVRIHGANAAICLGQAMHTFGELTEQLASRQTVAHNKGFFQTATELFVKDGKLRRGASSKPARPQDRKPGEVTGRGSARRLGVALKRLDLTFDTMEMTSVQVKAVLPREFAKWEQQA